MSYVLGLDLGTGSLKGLLMNKEGKIKIDVSATYPLLTLKPGYSEQDPKDWIAAAKKVIERIIEAVPEAAGKIEAISFSGQMHSLVLLDKEDKVLRNSILWNDVRTTAQCETIMSTFGNKILEITKNRALEGFTLPKMLWVQEHEPEVWKQVKHFLLPKDYLGFWLTGNKHMEYSDAAGTLLLDVASKKWSTEIQEKFNIDPKIFPDLVSSTDLIGIIRQEIAEELGLENSIPIFAGAADNAAAAVGAGIVEDGIALASIGTSGVFLTYEKTGDKNYKGELHYFNHAAEDAFYAMGVTLAAGHSLSWFKKTFAKNEDFDKLLAGIKEIPPGSNGLLFTPYIVGERSPHVDSQVRGSFVGIDINHTLKDFTRAVVEGITFSLKDSQLLMAKYANKTFHKVVSVGGGAKNKEWLQIQADIFDTTIVTLETEQGPAMGAIMIAAVGAGWFKDLSQCAEKFVKYTHEIEPNPKAVKEYQKVYALYREVYPATKEITHGLQKLK